MRTLLLATCFAVSAARAADYYVDKDATGANDGTSWTDAWQTFAAVTWGGGGVAAGDTLYISGGSTSKTYTEKWTVGASGTIGNPITISAGQDAGHNGLIIFSWDEGTSGTGVGIAINQDYVTLTGEVSGEAKMRTQDLINTSDRVGCYNIFSGNSGNAGVKILYVDAQNCNNPIKAQLSTGTEIGYCTMTFQGDAGVALVGSTGPWASSVHDCNFIIVRDSGTGNGPDGIQNGSGVDIYNNNFSITTQAGQLTTQHPDLVQTTGDYVKIYNNRFTNVADSTIDHDCFSSGTPNDIWIYNNIFEITEVVDTFPEFFRMYSSNSEAPIASITNLKFWNNTFHQNNSTWPTIRFANYRGNPTATGCEIKNNIFYECGSGASHPVIYMEASSGFVAGDWDTESNIYYNSVTAPYVTIDGTSQTAAAWVAANETNGSTSDPAFANAAGGDYRLTASSPAVGNGVDLSASFTTDYDGGTRQSWDIGAYRYIGSATATSATAGSITIE